MSATPRAQPSRTSLSRDAIARTIPANTARGAPSLSPQWHGAKQADAMRADGNRHTSSGRSVTTSVITHCGSLEGQGFASASLAEGRPS